MSAERTDMAPRPGPDEPPRKRRRFSLRYSAAGNVGVAAALLAPVLIGGAGIGVEAGFWKYRERTLQHLADVASYDGAVELFQEGSLSEARAAALARVADGNFRDDIGGVQANAPPTTGAFTGADAVEVIIQERWPRYLSALFLSSDTIVRARAVSEATRGNICVLALNTAATTGLSFEGSTRLTAACDISSNATGPNSLSASGGADVEVGCAYSAGGISGAASFSYSDCGAARSYASPTPDPLAALPQPSVSGPCKMPNNFGGSSSAVHAVTPGRYCGMTISRTANLAPGMYVIDGGRLRMGSTATVNGAGVTFFLINGAEIDVRPARTSTCRRRPREPTRGFSSSATAPARRPPIPSSAARPPVSPARFTFPTTTSPSPATAQCPPAARS